MNEKLYEDAVKLTETFDRIGCSLIQRKLVVGYAAASRLLDQMVENGIAERVPGSQSLKVIKAEVGDAS